MGLFNRLFGGDDSDAASPPVPNFDYELVYARGKAAVQKAKVLRDEWGGSATPVIVGTEENFSRLTDLWGEPEFVDVTPQDYLEAAGRVDVEKWFGEHRPEAAEDPEYLEQINKPSDWNTDSGRGRIFWWFEKFSRESFMIGCCSQKFRRVSLMKFRLI